MWNIAKAQLYQLKRERLVFAMFFLILVVQMIFAFGVGDENIVSGSEYITTMDSMSIMWTLFFVSVLVGEMMGKDFMDRTANYELMTGHLRSEVFWGRAVPVLVLGTIGTMLLILAPVVVLSAAYGWGDKITVGQYVVRYVLMAFPVLRIISEMIFLTMLAKNAYLTMILGYLLVMLGSVFPTNVILGVSNLNLLCQYPSWGIYSFGDYEYTMYQGALSASSVMATVLSSLLFGAGFLALSHSYFERDDLR